jgi:hypothetical protein
MDGTYGIFSAGLITVETLLTHTSHNPYTLITHTFWLLQNPNLHQN